jgi:hypothetical protein
MNPSGMVDRETLVTIRDEYPWASWAIWSETFPDNGCIETSPGTVAEFIIENRDRLTPDVVLLGLNRSDTLPASFVNFHAPTKRHYDYRLKQFIQDGARSRLQGAYMTDLVDDITPDSAAVTVTDEDVAVFVEQLELLDQTDYHVLCCGTKPFEGLVEYFDVTETEKPHEIRYANTAIDGHTLHLYRIWFYGNFGANQDKVEILDEQLQFLDDKLS